MNNGSTLAQWARRISARVATALFVTTASIAAHAVSPVAVPPESASSSGTRADDTDWPFYNREPTGMRFSALTDINVGNVAKLEEVCRVHVSGPGPFSSSIALVNGSLYVTSTLATVALDATRCDVLWKSIYTLEEPQVFNTNRGVGYGAGLVVRGTTDARLVAYDATNGQERWRIQVGDPKQGEFVSSAPQVWDGKVFVGIAGSDWGIQGRVMAFDVTHGHRLWSFNTVPGAGEPGAETWSADSWKRGGGGMWTSYTLDPATGELFVPVGNPAMTWNGDAREGNNLYTNSVLVLDMRSGRYLWHYQTVAHDTHDYDMTSPPVLATLRGGRDIVAVTPKDGYLYVIDRKARRLLYKTAATRVFNQDEAPSASGAYSCPGIYGGSEWNGPAFDPENQTLLTGQTDWCATLKRMETAPVYAAGKLYMGGTHVMDAKSGGWVTAFDASTGKVRWKYPTPAPITSGVTPTAGGITFVGDMGGTLYAFDSANGKVLLKIDTRGAIAGGVITYRIAGRQYVAITSGNISRSSWPSAGGLPSVVIYALPDARAALSNDDPGDPSNGRRLFNSTCVGCHGEGGKGGAGPALTGISQRNDYEALVNFIEHPRPPMPTLYPDSLTEQDVRDVARYLSNSR
jgi:PQQ-dependent dehydrogenase (methanol/ethanol family)